MAWFIVERERKTWTKYLVEAQDEATAMEKSDDWDYLGYVDGDDTDSSISGGPFESKEKALADLVSYVEG